MYGVTFNYNFLFSFVVFHRSGDFFIKIYLFVWIKFTRYFLPWMIQQYHNSWITYYFEPCGTASHLHSKERQIMPHSHRETSTTVRRCKDTALGMLVWRYLFSSLFLRVSVAAPMTAPQLVKPKALAALRDFNTRSLKFEWMVKALYITLGVSRLC